jgi:hypothetical protein
VRDDVLAATGREQEPFSYGSLGGSLIALVPAAATPGNASQLQDPASKAPNTAQEAMFVPSTGLAQAKSAEKVEQQLYLSLDDKTAIEINLHRSGFNPADMDGVFDAATRIAIMGWQHQSSFAATGYLTDEQAKRLINIGGPNEKGNTFAALFASLPEGLEQRYREAFRKLTGTPITYTRVGNKLFVAVQSGGEYWGVTFEQAKKKAEDLGGRLAVITSSEENRAIFEMIKDDPRFWINTKDWYHGPWIGYSRAQSGGKARSGWSWVSGGRSQFAAWSRNEPNEADFYRGAIAASFGGQGSKGPVATWHDSSTFLTTSGFIVEF